MTRRSDAAVGLALGAALAAARVLPRSLARGLGAALGRLARDPLALRRAVADQNLAIAFPELAPDGRAALGRRMYAHFGRMAADVLRFAATGPAAFLPLVDDTEGRRLLGDLLARGRGLIVLTGHLGNWELAGAWLGSRGQAAAVVKLPASRLAARYAEATRRRLGIETIPMTEARSGVLAALAEARPVALVADQSPIHGSTWVPFFGRPTKTPEGPGLFAARSGAPVVFGAMIAEPGGRFRLSVDVLDEEPRGETREVIERIATRYRARLEQEIRKAPEQYLWTHRLWRRKPPA
ncbi:MAG: hypothetical protein Q8Q85_11325 [Gemmatimonadales bacterium]|nr:hypothetical protein [Gemmatimonadales bacterium]